MSADGVTIGADQLRSELRDKSICAIDARRPEDYSKGHIPGAVSLPIADLLSDDSPERVAKLAGAAGIGDSTRVAVYDDTFGALASRIAWTLEYIGHKPVSLLGITYGQWQEMGLETGQKAAEPAAQDHGVSVRPEIAASIDELGPAAESGAVLLDNRERLNYLEQHIPGAASLPYRTLASPDGILRPRADMQRLLENRGISKGSRVITYCGSVGTLSGLAYYALQSAGVHNARLYVRSFKEWKSEKRPTSKQEHANYWDLSAE